MNIFALLDEFSAKDGLAFLMIGGHAVNAYGYSRITADLDILVNRDDRDRWLLALAARGFTLKHDGGGFLQTNPPEGCLWPLDLMLASPPAFSEVLAAAREVEQAGIRLRIPSLDHLFVMKLQALRQGPPQRNFKDFMDVLSLAQINGVEVRGDRFRVLCEKYGGKAIYERLVAFQS
jgi:hypothetical protein